MASEGEDMEPWLRVFALKAFRKLVEMENPGKFDPAEMWEYEDWSSHREAVEDMQGQLTRLGVADMLVRIVDEAEEAEVISEALRVTIALLLGGNDLVQSQFLRIFRRQPDVSEGFFRRLDAYLRRAQELLLQYSRRNDDRTQMQLQPGGTADDALDVFGEADEAAEAAAAAAGAESEAELETCLGEVYLILRLMQLLCEGHNQRSQKILAQQGAALRSFDMVTLMVETLGVAQRCLAAPHMRMVNQLLDTLVEAVQGPCVTNQRCLLEADVLEVAKRLLAAGGVSTAPGGGGEAELARRGLDKDSEDLITMQGLTVRLLLALLEGAEVAAMPLRMIGTLDFQQLLKRMARVYWKFVREEYTGGQGGEGGGMLLLDMGKKMADVTQAAVAKTLQEVGVAGSEHMLDVRTLPRDAFDGILSQGFDMFVLMSRLGDLDQTGEFKAQYEGAMGHEHVKVAYEFFKANTGRIELAWTKPDAKQLSLERVYFAIPPVCNYLTPKTRNQLLWNVNRSSPQDKIEDFFSRHENLMEEMDHQETMSRFAVFKFLNKQLQLLQNFSFAVAIVINLLILIGYESSVPDDEVEEQHSTTDLVRQVRVSTGSIRLVISVLGILQTLSSTLIVVVFFANFGVLLVRSSWKEYVAKHRRRTRNQRALQEVIKSENEGATGEGGGGGGGSASGEATPRGGAGGGGGSGSGAGQRGEMQLLREEGPYSDLIDISKCSERTQAFYYLTSLKFLFKDATIQYYTLYILFTYLGNLVSNFFFCYHLLDLVYRFESLRNVLRAVTHNGVQLVMTMLLGLIIVYVYSIFGFNVFRETYLHEMADGSTERMCESLRDCFVYTLDQGLRNGGGVGDILSPVSRLQDLYYLRVLFDLSFFAIVVIILLNIIFGIIIDTFADLRSDNHDIEDDMKNNCFICNIDRFTFDRQALGFETHIENDHNMWAYLFYIVFILKKSKTELSGLEDYVWSCIQQQLTSFFPLHKAMVLDMTQDETKDELERLEDKVDKVQQDLHVTRNALVQQGEMLRGMRSMMTELVAQSNSMVKLARQQRSWNMEIANDHHVGAVGSVAVDLPKAGGMPGPPASVATAAGPHQARPASKSPALPSRPGSSQQKR